MSTYEHQCTTAEEFLEFFRNRTFMPEHIYAAHFWGLNGYIFRGQSDRTWRLVPNCFRGNKLEDYTPQSPGPLPSDLQRLRPYLGMHMHAELRAVFLFMETADKLGVETPLDYSNVRQYAELVNAALNDKDADYDSPFPSSSTLNELALAQHHGVPTRLLDWTESPLTAAFFAAYKASPAVAAHKRINSERIAVFYISTSPFRESDSPIVVINTPRYGNTFLRVQRGLFTHVPRANRFLLHNGRWPSIEDIIDENPKLMGILHCVSLPTSEATDLLRLLYLQDITLYSMMPSLDNIAKAYLYKNALFGRNQKEPRT